MEDEGKMHYCSNCNEKVSFEDGNDGYFYCSLCGSQSDDLVDNTGLDDHLYLSGIFNTSRSFAPKSAPSVPQPTPSAQFSTMHQRQQQLEDDSKKPFSFIFEDDVSVPLDFGNAWMNQTELLNKETVLNVLRLRYVQGLQVMMQLQCQVLVEFFGATPAICGLSGAFWLRYLAVSGLFKKDWAEDIISSSEKELEHSATVDASKPQEKSLRPKRQKGEPRNSSGQKLVLVWCKYLKRSIPLRTSLAICFLACHIAREAILPTDISKWAREGRLPYISAFVSIEKYIGGPSKECPLSSRFLFWPRVVVDPTILETHAASIAENIGLLLPPVNFYAIAHRYLKQLSLPTEKILSHAFRIFEWSVPPDLWLSTNIGRLPTRVCVMSILVVSMRILYNINGFGNWEKGFVDQAQKRLGKSLKKACDHVSSCETESDIKPSKRSSSTQSSELDTTELLCHLEKLYDKLVIVNDYSKDLLSYLRYCKDVVFAGRRTSYEEDKFIEQLWNIYENPEDIKLHVEHGMGCGTLRRLREKGNATCSTDDQLSEGHTSQQEGKHKRILKKRRKDYDVKLVDPDDHMISSSVQSHHIPFEPLRRINSDMELNSFHYLPPRTRSKYKRGYICHERKTLCGRRIYVADADYYILLRACARLAEIDIRILHLGVLKFEKRLLWIEKQIDVGLRMWPEVSCNQNDTDLPGSDDMLEDTYSPLEEGRRQSILEIDRQSI